MSQLVKIKRPKRSHTKREYGGTGKKKNTTPNKGNKEKPPSLWTTNDIIDRHSITLILI